MLWGRVQHPLTQTLPSEGSTGPHSVPGAFPVTGCSAIYTLEGRVDFASCGCDPQGGHDSMGTYAALHPPQLGLPSSQRLGEEAVLARVSPVTARSVCPRCVDQNLTTWLMLF